MNQILDTPPRAAETRKGFGWRRSHEITTDNRQELNDLRAQLQAIDKSQAVIEFDMDGTILSANDNFLKALGYRLDEVQGKHHSMFVDPAQRTSNAYKQFWAELQAGKFQAAEYKRLGKGGREVWIRASYNPLLDGNGRPYRVIKFATDVTTDKLRNSEYEGQIAAIHKAQAVIEFDLDGTILFANGNFLSTMGYRLEEIVGKHHSLFVEEAFRNSPEYKQFWTELRNGNFQAAEYKRIGKGGREVWIQASYNPILDLDGKPVKVVKFATDVTAAKLRNADYEGQLAAINKVQAVIEFDLDGKVLHANPIFLAVVGYRLDEIQGKHHSMFVEPAYRSSREYALFWEELRAGHFQVAEYKRIGKGGREVWIQASYNPIFDLNGKAVKVVKYATDLTRSKQLAAEIVGNLDGAAATLGTVSGQVAAGAVQTAAQATKVAGAADQMNGNVTQLASAAEEMSATVKEIAANTGESAKISRQAQEMAANANSAVQMLSSGVGEIGKVSKVITAIAAQTNLLALNATIEAARAGEAGKGFAVVANEVKELAKQTAIATEEIGQRIVAIQNGTSSTVAAIEGIGRVIDQIDNFATSIAAALEEQAATVQSIARNANEVSAGVGDVVENIKGVASAAAEGERNATQAQQAAAKVREVSGTLEALFRKS